jgi:Flagellar biosynthesis protein, FliO
MEFILSHLPIIYGVLGLIALLVVGLILMKLLGGNVRGRRGTRLSISEYYEIDKSRRLVLVRRDEVEHLLLIGGNQDVVIESSFGSPLMTPAQQPRPAPRPPVFGGRRPMLRPVDNNDGQGNDQN